MGTKKTNKSSEDEFNDIIDCIENRAMASDGPITPTLKEATEEELSRLWHLLQEISSERKDLKKRIEELEAETTLYGVCFYSWDGGGSNSTLYRTIEEARAEMILEVNKKQKEKEMMEADEDGLKDYWHAIDDNAWTDGFENIAIQTYTLIPSTNGKQD